MRQHVRGAEGSCGEGGRHVCEGAGPHFPGVFWHGQALDVPLDVLLVNHLKQRQARVCV